MMDFVSIIGSDMLYNFHSHTQFCDGRATMAEFAAEAVAQGFTHYGFSPHSPVPIQSPCNMSMEQVPLFLDEVARLKALYAGKIRFYAAMEIDYLGEDWGPAHPYFRSLPLDYSIGSVHFIPDQDGTLVDIDGRYERFKQKMSEHFHDDIRYVVDTFYRQSIDMLRHGHFDIIGHFDKVCHNASHYCPGIEDRQWYQNHVNALIDEIIASGVTVEINTKAWTDHHRMFPAPRHWKRLLQSRVPVIINSDAHVPALINASRPQALRMLSET